MINDGPIQVCVEAIRKMFDKLIRTAKSCRLEYFIMIIYVFGIPQANIIFYL